jgi:hypothetical protein
MDLRALRAERLVAYHDRAVAGEAEDGGLPRGAADPHGIWAAIAENHRCNRRLWDEEDRARRTDVPDGEIVRCKRAIDRHNQRRNDAVEAIDAGLLAALEDAGVAPAEAAPLHSETPGAMIDRLSILALKIHHMGREARRTEAGAAHTAACAARLERLRLQRADLAGCLDRLLQGLHAGTVRFRVYRQFKMYNDPALNPCLYGRTGSGRVEPHAVP